MKKSDMAISKIFSARFLMAIMLTSSACIGFLNDKLSDEAFMSLAGAAVTAYFLRKDEDKPKSDETKKEEIKQ